MCLEFRQVDKRVASKNIIVTKQGEVKKNGRFEPIYTTTNFTYPREILVEKVNIKPETRFGSMKINEGYHSWISFFGGSHLFIIPKGTTYYVGGFNDPDKTNNYCSEQIIWIGHKLSPLTWLKVFLLNRKTK